MNIAFCGHRDYVSSPHVEEKILMILEQYALSESKVVCYTGGYGNFDISAHNYIKKAQKKFKNIEDVLVIPYLIPNKRIEYIKDSFDSIIYPPLETVPKKYAIVRRNEWMINNSDVLVAYVTSPGGAADTLHYAQKRGLMIFRIND